MSQQDVRLIALYLPQYHPIPENNLWWGKGFTEWTNVVQANPLFPGHYQPHIPADLGFCDLRIEETRQAQADLAREYGIHGFCYYHYWFNGRRLLNRPLDEVLASRKPDFPFCLCWANEHWTRAWDGHQGEILMEQKFSEDDDRRHIRWLLRVFQDRRYIRVQNKPLMIVYLSTRLPHAARTAEIWREEARLQGEDLYLCKVESAPYEYGDPRSIGFDACIEFQPDWGNLGPAAKRLPKDHLVFDYPVVVERMLNKPIPPYKRFPCVTPRWDNSPRRAKASVILDQSSPEHYRHWLASVIGKIDQYGLDEKIVFINAWNEWGEGNHLEPDLRFGRAYLEATRQAQSDAAVAKRDTSAGLVSLVILTFNQVECTKQCVESIRRHTPEPHEIVFVDNGSTDNTTKWLRKLVRDNPGYRLIENKKNLGFAKGCNQGIEASSGEYVLLLNNDTVVTEGWLAGMLDCLKRAPDAGIVSPLTNHISGRQKLERVGYDSLEGLDGYARRFRDQYRHRRIESGRVVGFCMLFRKSLAERIGLLDESFGTGNFEDDDFCLRALVAGYRNYIAGDVFIHHFGSRSFIGNRIDCGTSLAGNRTIFTAKWGTIDRKGPEGQFLHSRNILEKARELYQRGELQASVGHYLAAIRLQPGSRSIRWELAENLIAAKRFQDAIDILFEEPVTGPDKSHIALSGYCREGLNEDDEALRLAEEALALDGSFAQAHNLKGVLAYKRKERTEAEKYFRKAAECDPSWGEPLANLGVLQWSSGSKKEGLAALEKGFALSPTQADVAAMYHAAALEMGMQAQAVEFFRDAKTLFPDCRHLHLLLVDLLASLGKTEEAMGVIEQAMATFAVDDGILASALDIRNRIGFHSGAGGVSKKKAPLSLCMIVKNEEKHIARCLLSAQPVVDEIIIVDTGSTDRTADICRAFGAKVHEFAWTESFAEARNASLSKATGDWILVLDADEVLSVLDHAAFRKITMKRPPKPRAFTMVTRNYTSLRQQAGWQANDGRYPEEAGSGWFPSGKVRLFSRDMRIRFENPVHEIVEPSLRRIGVKVEEIDIPVHHYGKLDEGKTQEKGEQYYALGRKKLLERGSDAESLRELATQAMELGRHDEAFALWSDVAALRPDMARAHMNLAHLHLEAGRYREALEAGRKAVSLDPTMKEACLNCATGEFYAGDIGETVRILERLLERVENYPPAVALLAAAYLVLGEKEKAGIPFDALRRAGFTNTSFLAAYAIRLRQAGRPDAAALLERGEQSDRVADPSQPFFAKHPAISLCMIVRDEEASIERALSSVKSIVDEMIVVDTGSNDRTREIALGMGATVFEFPWCDDFSAARNFALSKAAGRWILVIDADEVLAASDATRLTAIVESARADVAGYVFLTRNYSTEMNTEGWTRNDGRYPSEEAGPGWFPSTKVRLFRNDPRIRYEGAIHEMIEPAMERNGLQWTPCNVPVHHYGPMTGKSKGELYYRLGQKKLGATAGDTRAVYELAVQAGRLRRFDEAIGLWQRYLELGSKEDRPLAYLSLGQAFLESGQYGKAIDASRIAAEMDPGMKEAWLNLAMAEFYDGHPGEAAGRLETLLSRTGDYPPAAALLSAAHLVAGEPEKAEERIRALSMAGLNPAAFFQVYASRLRDSGRGAEADTLLSVARRLWADELKIRGLDGSPEEVGKIMSAVDADIPPVQAASALDVTGDAIRS